MNKDLVRHRLQRAHEALESAGILFSNNQLSASVNRLYYALFYAVLALLETKELSSSKHSGVRALLNKHFIKAGIVPKEFGRFYESLFRNRQEGDYVDYTVFSAQKVEELLAQSSQHLSEIERIIRDLMAEHG